MKLPLTTLLPPHVQAAIGAIRAFPWRLFTEAIMLFLIYWLWTGLGDAKEHIGALEQHNGSLVQTLKDCEGRVVQAQQSNAATETIIVSNSQAKGSIDTQTQKLLKELREKANANKKCPIIPVGDGSGAPSSDSVTSSSGIAGLDRMLDMATCQAKQDGIPCPSTESSGKL